MSDQDSISVKEEIRSILLESGASEVGFAAMTLLSESQIDPFLNWLNKGMNAGMGYMERNFDLRLNPSLLLPETKTIISLTFPYHPFSLRDDNLPKIARFAYGEDYHKAIRKRLKPVCKELEKKYNCKTRICVDSAPIFERFWALKAGIGKLGLNRCVITEEYGSYVFLAEVLITLSLPPDTPSSGACCKCKACFNACPTGALTSDGVDASRCLSYLTIEHKGELSLEQKAIMESTIGRNTHFGCDICQEVCPHNLNVKRSYLSEYQNYIDRFERR